MSRATPLTVASYNVHRCIGRDSHHDPGRVAKVIQGSGRRGGAAGDFRYYVRRGIDQLRFLAEAAGLQSV